MAQVTLNKLVKHYDETPAVRGIDLDTARASLEHGPAAKPAKKAPAKKASK